MINIENIDFNKSDGLVPAIIQHAETDAVLMLGYMNKESLAQTLATQKVTFFSRTRQCLWVKGETSGNFLTVQNIMTDCDNDTLLITAIPAGPVCHTGQFSCFGSGATPKFHWLYELNQIIEERKKTNDTEHSYVARLFTKGKNRIAKKLGEEATEMIIESTANNLPLFKEEAADLLFFYVMLLNANNCTISDILTILEHRHQ